MDLLCKAPLISGFPSNSRQQPLADFVAVRWKIESFCATGVGSGQTSGSVCIVVLCVSLFFCSSPHCRQVSCSSALAHRYKGKLVLCADLLRRRLSAGLANLKPAREDLWKATHCWLLQLIQEARVRNSCAIQSWKDESRNKENVEMKQTIQVR